MGLLLRLMSATGGFNLINVYRPFYFKKTPSLGFLIFLFSHDSGIFIEG